MPVSSDLWIDRAEELWNQGFSVSRMLDAISEEKGIVISEPHFHGLQRRHPDRFPKRTREQWLKNMNRTKRLNVG